MLSNTCCDFRERILFIQAPENFIQECRSIINEADAQEDKKGAMTALCDLAVDLQSYLINWKLRGYLAEGLIKQSDIDCVVDMIYAYLERSGAV